MNKELKKISSMLSEKETKKNETIARSEAEYKETETKLADLHTKLENAENAEQYKTLLADIRDNEAVLAFCSKKLEEARNKTLTSSEYNAIADEAIKAFGAIQAESRPAIIAEIEKLEKLLSVYDSEVMELNRILRRASELCGTSAPMTLNAQTITAKEPEYSNYIGTFYKNKSSRDFLQRNIKK